MQITFNKQAEIWLSTISIDLDRSTQQTYNFTAILHCDGIDDDRQQIALCSNDGTDWGNTVIKPYARCDEILATIEDSIRRIERCGDVRTWIRQEIQQHIDRRQASRGTLEQALSQCIHVYDNERNVIKQITRLDPSPTHKQLIERGLKWGGGVLLNDLPFNRVWYYYMLATRVVNN